MANTQRWEIALVLLGLFVATETCEQKTAVLECLDMLSIDLTERLESRYGLKGVTTDALHDNTTLDNTIISVKHVLCDFHLSGDLAYMLFARGNATNQISVQCLMGNLLSCDTLLQDVDFLRRPLGYVTSLYWDEIKNGTNACEEMKTVVCSILQVNFQSCYLDLYGPIIDSTELTRQEVCQPDQYTAINCVMEGFKECARLEAPASLVNRVARDRWEQFSNASHLCGCYRGEECWVTSQSSIKNVTLSNSATVPEIYTAIIELAETMCRNEDKLVCASQLVSSCEALTSFYNDQEEIERQNNMASKVCPVIGTNAFSSKKGCVLDKLTNTFHPCFRDRKVTRGLTTCSDMKAIYACVTVAFEGGCGGNMKEAMFSMLRGDDGKLENCDYTSGANSLDMENISLHKIWLLYIIIISMIELF